MPAPSASRRKRKRHQNGTGAMPLLPPEVNEDDIEISDEDIEFVKQNKRYAGFLSGLDAKGITKQVLGLKPDWDGDDLEKFYEKKNETLAKQKLENVVSVDPVDALPVKNLDGKLEYRRTEKDAAENTPEVEKPSEPKKKAKAKAKEKVKGKAKEKKETEPERDEAEAIDNPVLKRETLEDLQTFVSVEEKRINTKTRIAELATGLISNPEESLSSLKELLMVCSDKDETVAQLAMLSSTAVFKDLLPGYRIRMPTEKELQMPVSKEVKKIRDYETTLLKSYQGYVKSLVQISKRTSPAQVVALKCMCGLLEAVPHFNYRDSLLRTVIPFTNAADSNCRSFASTALRSIFKNEGKHGGEATVEAVQLVADFVKEKDCNLQPDVLEVFLGLSFDEDIIKSADQTTRGGKEAHKSFKTKREEKIANKRALASGLKKQVEDDFQEASTLPDASERKKFQTLSLSAVFETFFRVLKAAVASLSVPDSQHPLLGVCLKGLLKFSHLISMDFLSDLFTVLRKLAEGGLPPEERLQCCSAAFKIMKANMDALTIDLKEFYVQFYNILLELHPDRNKENEIIFADALQVILCDSRQHDMQRVAAFIKRLGAVSFHFGSGTAMTALTTIRKLLSRYKQCRNMLENEPGGANATVFQLDGADPDLSGALSSVMWELSLLEKHYNPDVAKLSRQISNMLSAESLAAVMSPVEAMAAYSTLEGGFRPAVKRPPSKLVKRSRYDGRGVLNGVEGCDDKQAVDFRGYFRLLRDISENQALRKQHSRSKIMLAMYKRHKKVNKRIK